MFKRLLIANRGEIALRAVQACKEMAITAVTLYDPSDVGSLHVRLADETIRLSSPEIFEDGAAILQLAQERRVDAVYPGYGFLAEEPEFAQACVEAGIAFIGPPPAVLGRARDKLAALARVREAGFATVESSPDAYGREEVDALQQTADAMGYPLVVKSGQGGRGRVSRFIWSSASLERAIRQAQESSLNIYHTMRVYLEKAILPAHQISVQIAGDGQGNLVCLGEREGSLMVRNQKVIEESPVPWVTAEQRPQLWQTALDIARLFGYQNVGSVEFIGTDDGHFYFSEIKARIQVEHPLTEMRSGVDLVQEQFRIAAGEPLSFTQSDVQLRGWTLLARVRAEDPWNHFWPSPGLLRRMHLPTGPNVRVDTYSYSGCAIPSAYDPLFAKLTAWGPDRETSIARLRRALTDFKVVGIPTNIPLLQQLLNDEGFVSGRTYTDSLRQETIAEMTSVQEAGAKAPDNFADLAVAAAITYIRRHQHFDPSLPDRMLTGWHRDSRRLPG
jgi:acetyl/propionyl-CoA carboxylase alpha subunit